jgi:hypothetical protein
MEGSNHLGGRGLRLAGVEAIRRWSTVGPGMGGGSSNGGDAEGGEVADVWGGSDDEWRGGGRMDDTWGCDSDEWGGGGEDGRHVGRRQRRVGW